MPVRVYDAVINHVGENSSFINFNNQSYCLRDIADAFEDLAKVTITVKSHRRARTLSQNSLMHVYIGIISAETGNSKDVVKSVLKRLFLTRDLLDANGDPVVNPKTGEVVTYVQDTSDLSTIEAATFTEEIRMWALDFGIYLELPGEQSEMF